MRELKIYRLRKVTWFGLNYRKLWLAFETDHGYTVEVGEGEWMGFPKSIVENNPKLFQLYNKEDQKIINQKRTNFKIKPKKLCFMRLNNIE